MKNPFVVVCLVLFASSLNAQVAADKVFKNGKIYTADENQSFAEALAILDGSLVYVGDNLGVDAYVGVGTSVIDLEGKLILPGIHDIHIHLLEASSEAGSGCILSSSAWTVTELAQQLFDCNPEVNSNGWIFSWGHSIFTLLESGENPRNVLDSFFPTTPVVSMEETSHSAWINSAGLDLLGINSSTPDPVGGLIVKENGEPNGILLDSAGDLAFAAALATNAEIEQKNYDGLVGFGLPTIASLGITSICEGRTYWKRNYIETWQQVKADGLLTARVVLAPWAHPEDLDEELLPALSALYDQGDDLLKVTQIKAYIDGLTLNGTAALDQPYVYNFGWPFINGENYFTPERLQNYIAQLELLGFDFHIHAIGNRGVKEALDAIEGARNINGDVGARHRVTHLEIVNEEEFPRFAALNVIADVQVSGIWTQPAQWPENIGLVGAQLSQNYIPLKFLYDAGARVTLSSDWDVSTMNPFISIQNAVTRAPQNLPSVEAAVDARTIQSAYAMRNEDLTGSLEVGKYADLICVDQDIFEIPQNQIGFTQVTLTMLAGEVVYESNTSPSEILSGEELSPVRLYPTITQDYFTLNVEGDPNDVEVRIYNSEGKLYFERVMKNCTVQKIEVTQWPEGVYFVETVLPSSFKRFSQSIVIYR